LPVEVQYAVSDHLSVASGEAFAKGSLPAGDEVFDAFVRELHYPIICGNPRDRTASSGDEGAPSRDEPGKPASKENALLPKDVANLIAQIE
jgi:hypothetical protein